MSKSIKMVALGFCLSALLALPTYAQSPAVTDVIPTVPTVVIVTPPTTREIVVTFANQYKVSSTQLLDVMKCESGGKQSAVGDHGLAHGIFQFHTSTWNSFSKQLGEKLDINSKSDQAKLAAWAFSKGYDYHWSCNAIMGYS